MMLPATSSGRAQRLLPVPLTVLLVVVLRFGQEKLPSLRPAVEQQVDRRKARDEGPAAGLRIHRMPELLPGDADAGALERLAIEVLARAAHAAEERVGADLLAELEDQLRLRALRAELGAPHERRADAEGVAQHFEQREVEIDQPVPARAEDVLQRRQVEAGEAGFPLRMAARRGLDRRTVPGAFEPVVELLLEDAFLLRALQDRNGQPARLVTFRPLHADARAVLVVGLLELDVVEHYEQIRLRHAVQVPEPRHEARLVDGDDHEAFVFASRLRVRIPGCSRDPDDRAGWLSGALSRSA